MSMFKNPLVQFCLFFLGVFFCLCLYGRPLLPPDETRYLTVAWEMHVRDNFILPTMNYVPYHHKPPLLFWLINGLWQVFGIAEWPARLLVFLCTAGFIALSYKTLETLKAGLGKLAALLLLASPLFVIYSTHIMFDVLMGLFVLLAIFGLIKLSRGARPLWWVLVGAAMGIGALAKGPAILVHVVPLALLMPVWTNDPKPKKIEWYFGVFLSVVLAFLVGFSWAIPAALQGGAEYARMIFFGQSTGRMVHAFDHARPFWWYVPIVPAFLALPLLLPQFWQAVKQKTAVSVANLDALKFLLCWAVPVLVLFSAMSGKQVHYLLPIVPALCGAVGLYMLHTPSIERTLYKLATASFVVLVVFFVAGQPKIALYNINPIGQALQEYAASRPIAIDSKYDGEYGFVGRLTKPVVVLQHNEYAQWFAENPNGILIHRYRAHEEMHHLGYSELFEQQFRKNQEIGLYTANPKDL